MLRKVMRKLGLAGSILALTVIAIPVSLGITLLVTRLLGHPFADLTFLISIIAPCIVAPLLSYLVMRLLFELDEAEERLRLLSIQDDITGSYNRRYFIELAEKEWARARRYREEFAIVLFDLDDFKKVNDTYGHLAGDQVLRQVSAICQGAARAVDTFARFGGDEFVFLVPQSAEVDLLAFMERVRLKLAEAKLTLNGNEVQVTVSMGACRYDPQMRDLDSLLVRADEDLYRAKEAGGNYAVLTSVGAPADVLRFARNPSKL